MTQLLYNVHQCFHPVGIDRRIRPSILLEPAAHDRAVRNGQLLPAGFRRHARADKQWEIPKALAKLLDFAHPRIDSGSRTGDDHGIAAFFSDREVFLHAALGAHGLVFEPYAAQQENGIHRAEIGKILRKIPVTGFVIEFGFIMPAHVGAGTQMAAHGVDLHKRRAGQAPWAIP